MEIEISASRPYPVLIRRGLADAVGETLRQYTAASTVCVLSDDTVYALYGDRIRVSLQNAGFETVSYVFAHGEERKNLQTYNDLLSFLAESELTRTDAVLTLGGGVVCDLGAFAAATYMRGIDLFHMPTTLLCCMDASVGGKAAVDLPQGKNLAGVFYQPRAVLCDPDLLATLPDPIFRDGCAEVIKYAMITKSDLPARLRSLPPRYANDPDGWERVIADCVAIKGSYVSADETDRGVRRLLNFGHTVGHAAEAASEYTLSHGRAVAAGMAAVTRGAVRRDLCSKETYTLLCDLLARFGLPDTLPDTLKKTDTLMYHILRDKKKAGGRIGWILPEKPGVCREVPMGESMSRAFLVDCFGELPC